LSTARDTAAEVDTEADTEADGEAGQRSPDSQAGDCGP
jgi:hypothetical protein